MSELKHKRLIYNLIIAIFFTLCLIYYAVFNRYHIYFQEQTQLFVFNLDYLLGYLDYPGGFSSYIGAFITQFFISPFAGALILTVTSILIYILTDIILKKHSVNGILFSIIPVMIHLALTSDYRYSYSLSAGLILSLTFIAFYYSLTSVRSRIIAALLGWILLYVLAGGFSLLAVLLGIIHELTLPHGRSRRIIVPGFLMLAFIVPLLAWRIHFNIPFLSAWCMPVTVPYIEKVTLLLLSLISYYPLAIVIVGIILKFSAKKPIDFRFCLKNLILGTVIFLCFIFWILKYNYDKRTETLLKIDYYVQHDEWSKALRSTSRYDGTNRLITYFTNLALYKTGQLGNSMFFFDNTGKEDLWLEWPGGKLSLFFGSEFFFHLGYLNETFRRAYDAMILTGQNPRSLKILARISLVNGNLSLATKHLNTLDKTLFYRKWSRKYNRMVHDKALMQQDKEVIEKSKLLIDSDFLVDTNDAEKTLLYLLKCHPENRMAYEYLLASLLLEKNLTSFISYVANLGYYRFREVPVHYEEAMLVYMNKTNMNIVPAGFKIKENTIVRFKAYYNDFTTARSAYSGNLKLMAQHLKKDYGNTYWYYLNFTNNNLVIR